MFKLFPTIKKHDEAPSGEVRFYHYKEPFMPNPKPYFGYQGVLLHDAQESLIQCSFCGKWLSVLSWKHLKTHSLTGDSYKKMFGLSQKTALVNEQTREKLIKYAVDSNTIEHLKEAVEKRKKTGVKQKTTFKGARMEQKNKTGTCPEQILDRLEKLKKELGRQPSYHEANKLGSGLIRAALNTYGSWSDVCKVLGWRILRPGQGLDKFTWDRNKLLRVLINFKKNHKREPTYSDVRRKFIPDMNVFYYHFGKRGFSIAKEIAYKRVNSL